MEPSHDWLGLKFQEDGQFTSLDAMVQASHSPEEIARALAYQKLVGGPLLMAPRRSLCSSAEGNTQESGMITETSSAKRFSKGSSITPVSTRAGTTFLGAPTNPYIKRFSTSSFKEAVRPYSIVCFSCLTSCLCIQVDEAHSIHRLNRHGAVWPFVCNVDGCRKSLESLRALICHLHIHKISER